LPQADLRYFSGADLLQPIQAVVLAALAHAQIVGLIMINVINQAGIGNVKVRRA
jgi:hypothetical protein